MSDFRAHIQADLDLGKAKSQMDAFLNQKKKVKLDVDTGSLNSLKDQLNGLGKNTKIKPQVDTSGVKSIAKEFQTIKSLANQMSKTKVKIAGLDTSKNANELKAYQSQLKGMQSQYKDLMNTFGDSFSKSQKGALENIFKGADAKIEVVNAKAKDLANTMSKAGASFSKYEAIAAGNKTAQFLKDNTKLSKEYRSVLEDIESKQRSATSRSELTDANKEYRAAISSAKLMGQTGKSFGSEFKRAFGQIGQFVGIYGVMQKGVQTAGQMAKAVLEVDTSMTELRKVSDASDFQLNEQFDKAAVSAQKYGANISDIIATTADWSRLGYGLKDATKLADATTMLQRVGDNMTQESSSEGLISILKGFQKDSSEANSIVDKINEVANNEPIDTAGITSALQRSASSLSAAGNTIDESIGMITAANSVVQDPESVGTAFKTMSMRIRGAKTELESAGEDTDGMAESTAKLQEEMKALSNVDIMKDKNTFKSTYQILDELADKWQSYSDIQQASITELVAGKRQGNIMSALMTNWDVAKDSVDKSLNSEGSAEKELESVQKSLQYSLDKLKATGQEFSTTMLDSSVMKGVVDGAQSLLSVFTKIAGLGNGKGLLGMIGGGVGIGAFMKNLDWGKSSHKLNLLLSESIIMEKAA